MIDLKKYAQFVDGVTSQESKDGDAFTHRIADLYYQDFDTHRLLTAAVGLCAESGEFTEIIKKIIFQGKPYNEASREHMIVELGDVMWYIAQACMSLGVSIDDLVIKNVQKLSARYPEGAFQVYRSENRKEGDI